MEQDIWNWKIFPDKIPVAGLSCREKIISSKDFHAMIGPGMINRNVTNLFPINCNSIISLTNICEGS